MKRLLNAAARAAVTALLLSSSAMAAPPALPDADPAMWVVKDQDTTIYLFGTFHGTDGKQDWFNDEVKTAFDASDELVVEAITPEDPAKLQPMVMKYAVDATGPGLSAKLKPETKVKLDAALTALGAPPSAFDRFRPFFVGMNLSVAQLQKVGIDQKHGAETVLTAAAKAASKPVREIESAEFQLGMMASIPEKDQLASLEETVAKLDQIGPEMLKLMHLWGSGDAERFGKLMQDMSASSPVAHKIIFTDRNAIWAKWIDDRLDKPGTVFMAVGTGHLAGNDSVQALLSKRGIKAARVPAS